MQKKHLHLLLRILFIAAFIVLVIWVNRFASESDVVTDVVSRFGYVGLFVISVISGFNVVVPVPVIAFFPFLVEIGFHSLLTVVIVAVGMTTGDFLGFLLGRVGRRMVEPKNGKIVRMIERLEKKHTILPYVFIFLYASFAPIPNEVIVIPLAFLGFRMWKVMVAVLFGNIIFNSIIAFGVHGVFSFFS